MPFCFWATGARLEDYHVELFQFSASSRLFRHACHRSLLARLLSICSRAPANSLHALWPIRTPRPHLRQPRCLVAAKCDFSHIHTSRFTTHKAIFYQIYFFPSLKSDFGQFAYLTLGTKTSHFGTISSSTIKASRTHINSDV